MTDKIPVLPKGPDDKTPQDDAKVSASTNDLGLSHTSSGETSQGAPSFGEMLSKVAHAAPPCIAAGLMR